MHAWASCPACLLRDLNDGQQYFNLWGVQGLGWLQHVLLVLLRCHPASCHFPAVFSMPKVSGVVIYSSSQGQGLSSCLCRRQRAQASGVLATPQFQTRVQKPRTIHDAAGPGLRREQGGKLGEQEEGRAGG